MPLIHRQELAELIKKKEIPQATSLVLFFGERYLCKEAADSFSQALLEPQGGTVHPLDGDQEDPGQTLAKLLSFSLLPGLQIFRVSDSRIFHSKSVSGSLWDKAKQAYDSGKQQAAIRHLVGFARIGSIDLESTTPFSELSSGQWEKQFGCAKPAGDVRWADTILLTATGTGKLGKGGGASIADRYIQAFESGIPPQNCLLLTSETVDKRQKLFTFIKKHGLIVDCSVAAGAGTAAQKEQKGVLREMVQKRLAEFGKRIEPKALEMFYERVGFHPVAAVMEMEKLSLYVGDKPQISCEDLEKMVGRSREDALFELTDAFSKRQTGKTLTILQRLQEQGTHGLAILATMRNFLRKMLVYRSLQLLPSPVWHSSLSARDFQNSYLPALKERNEFNELLGGHPYALYMSFLRAGDFSCNQLKKYLTLLLEAEYRLKGSPLPQHIVLEELFLAMLRDTAMAK